MLTDKPSIFTRPWLTLFIKTGSILALAMVGLGVIGVLVGQWWAKENLAPLVAKELTKTIDRLIDVGKVEDLSWNRLVFGKSSIAATAGDRSKIDIDRLEINFDPLKVVTARTLKLDVKVTAPQVYLERGYDGSWLKLPKLKSTPAGDFKTQVGRIQIDDGRAVLLANPQSPAMAVAINGINGAIDLSENQQQLKLGFVGIIDGGGKLDLRGESAIDRGMTKIALRGEKLGANLVGNILAIPMVSVDRGTVDGAIELTIDPHKPLALMGTALLKDTRLKIAAVPKTFDRTNGFLQITEQQVKFNNVTTQFDRINGLVNGSIDFKSGYQLNAKTKVIKVEDLLTTIDLKLPVPLQGAAAAELELGGKLDRPILTGRFINSQPVKIDRVTSERASGNFKLADGNVEISATLDPQVGGKVITNGIVSLAAGNKLQFRVRGNGIDGDKLGTLYNVSLPAGMAIGKTVVDGIVSGGSGNINTDLNIAANEATYPTNANLNIDPNLNIKLRSAETIIAGGKVRSSGSFSNNNWRLDLSTQSIDGGKLATLAGTSLLPQYAGKLAGNIRLNGSIDPNCQQAECNSNPLDRLQATGNLNYRLPAGNIAVNSLSVDRGKWQGNISTSAIDLTKLNATFPKGSLSGKFKLQGDRIDNIDPERIIAAGTGKINFGSGREVNADRLVINNGNWQGNFTARNLAISEFNPQVKGNLDGKFTLAGNTSNFSHKSIAGNGNAVITLPQGKLTANNFQIDRGKYRGNLAFANLSVGKLLPEIDRQLGTAKIDGNFNLSGDIDKPNVNSIALNGSGKIQLDRGSVSARTIQIDNGKWAGNFTLDRLPLSIAKGSIPVGLLSGKVSGNFSAAGEIDNPTVDQLRLAGSGKIDLGDSLLSSDRIELDDGNWQGNLKLKNFALSRLDNLPRQMRAGRLTGDFDLAGNLSQLTPTEINLTGNGNLAINGGNISARNLQLAQGDLQGDIAINNIRLGDFNPQLSSSIQASRISGNFRTTGNLNDFTPENIGLSGNGKINNILGGKIDLANINLDRGNWQGEVKADRLNIASLKQFAPNANKLPDINGRLSGVWQLGGNFKELSAGKIQATGNTQLTDLSVGELKFYPSLAGDVRIDPTAGMLVALAGGSDRFDFQLDRNMQPQAFNFQQQGVTATGNVSSKVIDVRVAKLPVSFMQKFLPASIGLNQYRWQGECSGNLQVNLATAAIAGRELVIDKPVFGAFMGDRLTGNFNYDRGQLTLDRVTLDRDKYRYVVSGKIDPNNRAFDLSLQIPQGKLADIRNLLQINSNRDLFTPLNQRKYGTAKDLGKAVIGYRQTEIQRESLDEAEEAAKQPANLVPNFGNLDGDFSGSIAIANRSGTGIQSTFDLAGSNWYIDKYKLDRVQVNGKWENGRLILLPLSITKAKTVLNLSGNFGLDRQTGDLQIENAPVEWMNKFIKLPIDLAGGVNLQAKLDGNIFDPQINGKISLNNPHIDRTKLDTASGNFNYRDGRLEFDARATFPNDKPNLDLDRIAIVGSIPYRLPFNKAAKDPNLNIEIDLADRGMQAIDVFSKQQLRWIDGKGSVDVKVTGKVNDSGKIENLTASGTAEVIDAKINSTALAAPLTNVNGQILFDLDRIDVQKLTGTLDRGRINITGLLPISENFTIDKAQRLSIVMQGIPLNITNKYQGNIDGNINLKGTALKPTVGGNITLSNGRVFLPDTSADTEDIIKGIQPEKPKTIAQNSSNIQLKKLQVVLGENLQIDRPPILSFVATGTIDIEGTPEQPRPFGQVTLPKGAVNLFTTQFRLANGYPQTADFFPTLGPDPVLNIRLQAKVLESNANPLAQRNSIARTPKGNEINETVDFYSTSLGSVQTVQIDAKIAGLASQVTQRLELNSTPPRTQPEILLLLGGGLVERLGGANNDIGLGIVNLAGSTLLNNIQDRISDTLSLSDFRLFPTVSKETKTSSASTLGIAAEVGVDLTPKISTSVFKIITNSELPQYSLRYRIDDRLLLRGSTNLFGDNRATIEFEQRF